MFRTTGQFDKLLDKATSHLLMEPDWPSILQLSDLVRQNDVQPKIALASLKKKMFNANQHTAWFALLALESMVKNCGSILHEELTNRAYCDALYELARTTPHDKVRNKLLELIQAWSFAFRKSPKHGALKDTMNTMKAEGYKFPVLHESDAMFSANSAPEWADGDVCHRCRVAFSLIQRKHHCRACGQVFCSQCTQKQITLPKYGIEKEVRVCDACYEQATKPSSSGSNSKTSTGKDESDLPPEYISSSLAQQSQAPPRKSDEELREQEEFELALAISQSEAEAKEKEKFKMVKNTYKAPVERSPSPVAVEEQPSNPELARYLNRSFWESINQNDTTINNSVNNEQRAASPSAPATAPESTKLMKQHKENGVVDADLEEFISTLKSQVEIFINRMKSNSSRGRSIANDTSVQTLFMNITAMHSKLLRYIQQHDDSRLHYERLQDKLTQVKDARAALDDLREEHREKLRREAEEAERQRQLQMAHKLEIMRKKKQEYLQYQRQLALQRIQEQEREMQMRQEHQKQQYLMGYMGANQFPPQQAPPNSAPPYLGYQQYGQGMMMQQAPQSAPHLAQPHPGIPPTLSHHMPPPSGGPPGFPQMPQQNYGVRQVGSQPMMNMGSSIASPIAMPSGPPQSQPVNQQNPGMHQNHGMLPQNQAALVQNQNVISPPGQFQQQLPPQVQQQQQPPPPPPQENGETNTAELISFD